jgi:hypothetical protein
VDQVIVRTNNVPREIIDGCQLTAAEREDFDYHDWTAIEDGTGSASFFRYRGELYDLGNFMRWSALSTGEAPDWMDRWDGYASDSFSSGMVVRFVQSDYDTCVVVGSYYTTS